MTDQLPPTDPAPDQPAAPPFNREDSAGSLPSHAQPSLAEPLTGWRSPYDAVPGPRQASAPPQPAAEPATTPAPTVIVQRGARWWQSIAAAFVGGALVVGGVQLVGSGDTEAQSAPVALPAVEVPATTSAPLIEDTGTPVTPPVMESDAVAVGEKVIPSIVTVQVGNGRGVSGSGSGVIISDSGYIVTNDHVVDVGSAYQVVLSDGRTTYEAELIGTDPLTDLAVLQIDADDLVPVELGATTTLSVGDVAVAVGSPLGLEGGPSLTVGVVSAFGRQVQTGPQDVLYGMLQTDAPITQGSSGGALVDGAGRLIGITTAVGVSDVGVEGIGFATPVELMRRVANELIAEGDIEHAFLGITGSTSFATTDDGARVAVGVEVNSVEAGSTAAVAGIAAGDLITAIDGEVVLTMEELIVALRVRAAGDAVTLEVNGQPLPGVLGSR